MSAADKRNPGLGPMIANGRRPVLAPRLAAGLRRHGVGPGPLCEARDHKAVECRQPRALGPTFEHDGLVAQQGVLSVELTSGPNHIDRRTTTRPWPWQWPVASRNQAKVRLPTDRHVFQSWLSTAHPIPSLWRGQRFGVTQVASTRPRGRCLVMERNAESPR